MTAVQTRTGTEPVAVVAPSGLLRNKRRRNDLRDALGFLAPFLAVYVLFLLTPVVQALYMSGFDWDLLGATREFIGLDNYTRMLWGTDIAWSPSHLWPLRGAALLLFGVLATVGRDRVSRRTLLVVAGPVLALVIVLGFAPSSTGGWNDPGFWISLKNTLVFTAISTPILVALGLALALAVNSKRRAGGLYRTFFFLPFVLPVSAVTLIWSYLLNPDRGLIAGALEFLGLPTVSFLSDPSLAMPAIIATTVWWSVGFNLVLFSAGLQDIDPSLHEAASLDGASTWQRLRHITVPGLRHVTVLVAVTQLIASFQIFGQVYIMTRGGPGTATQVLIQQIYEAGFKNYELGYAATVSVFLFVVMSAVSAVQFRLISKDA